VQNNYVSVNLLYIIIIIIILIYVIEIKYNSKLNLIVFLELTKMHI